jgi:hypothetical protein
MKVFFTLLLLSFSIVFASANNPDETNSNIRISGDEVTISIEVPWSISEAVSMYRKNLINQDKSLSFKQHLESYIYQNFMLIQDNKTLEWISFSFSDKDGESAEIQLKYKVERGTKLFIQNTLLFNINKKQENRHKVSWDNGEEFIYITEKSKFNFELEKC